MITIQQNKEKLRASRNLTLIVLCKCVIYLICLTPYLIAYIIRYVSSELRLFQIFSEILLDISHRINFFIYLKFNKLFRRTLNIYLRKFFKYIWFR